MGLFSRKKKEATPAPTPKRADPTPPPRQAGAPTDLRSEGCPYCGVVLKKVPAGQTKCPSCKQKIVLRVDPRDNTYRTMTEVQAYEVDMAMDTFGTPDYPKYVARVEEKRAKLREKFGSEPKFSDIAWGIMNEDILRFSARRNFDSVRNTYTAMMRLTAIEGKTVVALDMALRAYYMLCCGPYDENSTKADPATAWDASYKRPAGELTEWLEKYAKADGKTVEEAARAFEPAAAKMREGMKMPVSWADIWPDCL